MGKWSFHIKTEPKSFSTMFHQHTVCNHFKSVADSDETKHMQSLNNLNNSKKTDSVTTNIAELSWRMGVHVYK